MRRVNFKEDLIDDMQENIEKALLDLTDAMAKINDHTGAELVEAIVLGDVDTAEKVFSRWLKREKQGGLGGGDY